ncbi:MAG: hypothetical protein QOE92_1451 [Chloroflexota bacterium]|jgi:RNA polymerase sigma-70 factor (ECF subfamily)|nr:hypothetical protein [Chloroflexota bacterium]
MVGVLTTGEVNLRSSFEAVYDAEASGILAYLTATLGDPAEAEDLVAETFLKAWREWPRFRDQGKPVRSWLIRIARNLAIDRWRRMQRTGHHVTLQPGMGPALAAEGRTVDRLQLLAAAARSPRGDRHLLALRAAGLSFAEMAADLGKTEPAAKMAWYRAAERMRAHLER